MLQKETYMSTTYSVACDKAPAHIPAHPDRTAVGQTNPFFTYFREFSSRQAMERWFRRQSWQDRQEWSPWMASASNRQNFARTTPPRSRLAKLALCGQQSLFA